MPRFRRRKDVKSNRDLQNVTAQNCGKIISLQHVPPYLYSKLFDIVGKVELTKLALQKCFNEPSHTLCILKQLTANQLLQRFALNIRENHFNEMCCEELRYLISKGVLTSLELPGKSINAKMCEDLLSELYSGDSELDVLDIRGATLTDTSLEYLESLITEKKITKQLILRECRLPDGYAFTMHDKQMLINAVKSANSSLKILWFETDVPEEDASGHGDRDMQVMVRSYISPLTGIFGNAGRMAECWFVNNSASLTETLFGRKRKRNASHQAQKVLIVETDVDNITHMLRASSIHTETVQQSDDIRRRAANHPGTSHEERYGPNDPTIHQQRNVSRNNNNTGRQYSQADPQGANNLPDCDMTWRENTSWRRNHGRTGEPLRRENSTPHNQPRASSSNNRRHSYRPGGIESNNWRAGRGTGRPTQPGRNAERDRTDSLRDPAGKSRHSMETRSRTEASRGRHMSQASVIQHADVVHMNVKDTDFTVGSENTATSNRDRRRKN